MHNTLEIRDKKGIPPTSKELRIYRRCKFYVTYRWIPFLFVWFAILYPFKDVLHSEIMAQT